MCAALLTLCTINLTLWMGTNIPLSLSVCVCVCVCVSVCACVCDGILQTQTPKYAGLPLPYMEGIMQSLINKCYQLGWVWLPPNVI